MQTAGARWADCIAIGREKDSDEYIVHGIEIKSSAADIKNEIKKPEKSAPFKDLCHHWWMLCPKDDIMTALDLPSHWGVATHSYEDTFSVIRDAPFNSNASISTVFAYSLMNAIQRQRHEEVIRTELRQMVRIVGNNYDLLDKATAIHQEKQDRYSEILRSVRI